MGDSARTDASRLPTFTAISRTSNISLLMPSGEAQGAVLNTSLICLEREIKYFQNTDADSFT
jgi:hypothetical protein